MKIILATFVTQVALVAIATGQMPPDASVLGHVYVGETGVPDIRATVSLQAESFGGHNRVGQIETDENGGFRFDNVKYAGDVYWLSIEQPGFLPEYVLHVEPGRAVTVRLRRSATISGRVLGADGKGITKAVVEIAALSYTYGAVSLQPVSKGFAYSDDHGNWRIPGLAPGSYYLRTSCDGYDTVLYPDASGLDGANRIELREGSEMEGLEFRLRRAPRFSLEGQLIDSEIEAPAQAKFLRAYSADLIAGTFVDGAVRSGEFRLEGLKPGRYFLNFEWLGATNNVVRSAIFPVEVGDADQQGLVLRVARRTKVAGRLDAAGHKLPCCLSVYLEPTSATVRAKIGGSGSGSNVASDGSFKIAGVEAGEYRVRVQSGEPSRFFVREPVLIVDGHAPATGVNLKLDFSAGTVAGRALDQAGVPISGAVVVLQSIEPEKLTNDLYRRVYGASPAGSYSITDVVPGDYLLFAWRGASNLIGDPALFEQALRRARRVTVQPGGAIKENAPELLAPQR
jgi:Carboxypeptidase regulatory-like domain